MPILDFGMWPMINNRVHFNLSACCIKAAMHYPDAQAEREEFYECLLVARLLRSGDTSLQLWEDVPLAMLRCFLESRHEGRSVQEIVRQANNVSCRASLAGEILLLVYYLKANGEEASINKACHILLELARNGYPTMARSRIPYKNRKAIQDQAWLPYKSVAHFWAAYKLLILADLGVNTHIPPLPELRWMNDHVVFLKFLAIAETFRHFGETYIPHARKDKALLNPCETWHLPDGFPLSLLGESPPPWLGEPFIFSVYKLYATALQTYRAKIR